MRNPFRCFNSSPEVIHLTVMMYVRLPRCRCGRWKIYCIERGIDICHEKVRFWWNRFGPICSLQRSGERRIQHRLVFALALASRRGLCADQRYDALSLARR